MSASQQRLVHNWSTKASTEFGRMPRLPVIVLSILVLTAVFAPFISPHSPLEGNLALRLMPPAFMNGGRQVHPLGTDAFGRDILSRLIYGSRISLIVALITVFIAGGIGTFVGLVSAYYGGFIEGILMRITDMMLSIPMILMAIVLTAATGPSFFNVILVVSLLLWPRYARQIYAETLSVKQQDFVALARIAGCSASRIMWRHIFPNVMPTFLVLTTLQVGLVIILEASLSYLGVGLPPPQASWGVMVADGQRVIASAWWISMWPGLAIMFTVLSLNMMGDWVRDRLDPKLRTL